ncbi:glycosyltransferase family 2 protein [Spirosoma sp. KUDC1026]|uniref:glycosyltransferase family 2 protein n=1 Tax=Spirosoma sp. KUDC1026 TaxID=2745947 RepID=UPI00159BAC2E|nr:glycosyltransferase family 2 protein [Spirosoma sp. KUDC1026]QKZ13658.1 glycosyltransferase family 2 protein [Spirosoma sp. KUDC1026]
MTISGFSYIRNGFKYQYPFLESIQSILPLCDEFVIAVGQSEDGTREAIEALNSPKIRIIDTVWDEALRQGGQIFAQQANVALDACTGDWLFHIQADEIIHEKDLPAIRKAIEQVDSNPRVEGLLFDFLNFYGSYDYLNGTRYQHRREIRIFRRGIGAFSYRDSQGFRRYPDPAMKEQGHKGMKLHVKLVGVPVYHYSYVRSPKAMTEKSKYFASFWFDDAQLEKAFENDSDETDYYKIERVKKFTGTHPAVMAEWIKNGNYDFDPSQIKGDLPLKKRMAYWLDALAGRRIGEYKNYKLIS